MLAAEGGGYRFSQDYVFTSPSTAAAVVLGRSANGRIEWKDAQGRTLKELQTQEAAIGWLPNSGMRMPILGMSGKASPAEGAPCRPRGCRDLVPEGCR